MTKRQPIRIVRDADEVPNLLALFDALLAIPCVTCAVLWRRDSQHAEYALTLWASGEAARSAGVELERKRDSDGEVYALEAYRADGSSLVAVRLDDPDAPVPGHRSWRPSDRGEVRQPPTRQQLADRQLGEEIAATYRSKP